jgi:hypothetical protein
LGDVTIEDVAQGHTLQYDAATAQWKNLLKTNIFVSETEPAGAVTGDLWFW